MSDGGKGSAPRPFSVSNEEYAKRWDAIFGRDVEEEKAFEEEIEHNKKLGLIDVQDKK